MQVKDWITAVLVRHNIHHPNQRPLYQYRINDAEFESALLHKSAVIPIV